MRWGKPGALVITAVAFGMAHYSAQRMLATTTLGLLLGLLVLQYRSIWPAMIAHFLHNAITVTAGHPDGLRPWLLRLGYPEAADAPIPTTWVIAAAVLVALGVLICLGSPRREHAASVPQPQAQATS